MKKIMTFGMLLLAISAASFAQDKTSVKKICTSTSASKPVINSKTHTARLKKFVDEVVACDTLSKEQKEKVTATYKAFLAEHRAVKDSLSDEDVRQCSKQKVRYQKAMAQVFVSNASDDVVDTAQDVGEKVSKFLKKTGKKIQGAIDGFKDN